MSAALSHLSCLSWARAPEGPPPRMHPLELRDAIPPPSPVMDEARRLAGIEAAKLLLEAPPLGDGSGVRPETVCLALALGVRQHPKLARLILGFCPRQTGGYDLLLRHAIAAPALAHVGGDDLGEQLRDLSPLTGLLLRPSSLREGDTRVLARRVIERPDGRRMLQAALAAPPPASDRTGSAAILKWRAQLMNHLRTLGAADVGAPDEAPPGTELVLDIYETASLHHQDELRRQCREAAAILADVRAGAGGNLRWAIDLGRWWGPLRAVRRTHREALRRRRLLDVHLSLEGVRLCGVVEARTGESA